MGALPCVDPALRIDSDGDGSPDWWETRYRFDPLDPADGETDADADELSNREEREARTDPRTFDTDGDGLGDGAEVLRTRTVPWEGDSDGDGAGDGVEVNAGSDPLDPLGFPSDIEGLFGLRICEDAVVFLLDRSHSMAFDPWGDEVPCFAEARWALAVAISSLRSEQRFAVVGYENTPESPATSLAPATPAKKREARDWVLSVEARGKDCLADALDAASGLLAGERGTKGVYLISTLALGCAASSRPLLLEACAGKLARMRRDEATIAHTVFFESCAREYLDIPGGARGAAATLARNGGGRLLHRNASAGFLPAYVRGDANGDWRIDLADAIAILSALFAGGPPPVTAGAAEVSADGHLDLADAIYLLSFLFASGPAPPAPFPEPDIRPATHFLRACGG